MKFGYARVSTKDQNLDRQIDALEKEGCEKIYADKYTGSSLNRPEFNELRKVLRKGDMVVVHAYDRLSRSLRDSLHILDDFMQKGINLKSIQQPWIDTSTPQGRIAYEKNAVDVNAERVWSLERSRHGMEVARARGKVGGRKYKLNSTQVKALKQLYEGQQHSIAQLLEMFKISNGTLYRYLNKKE
jgi:DNA invertase Pin-like site-specific DNA recombinase